MLLSVEVCVCVCVLSLSACWIGVFPGPCRAAAQTGDGDEQRLIAYFFKLHTHYGNAFTTRGEGL